MTAVICLAVALTSLASIIATLVSAFLVSNHIGSKIKAYNTLRGFHAGAGAMIVYSCSINLAFVVFCALFYIASLI